MANKQRVPYYHQQSIPMQRPGYQNPYIRQDQAPQRPIPTNKAASKLYYMDEYNYNVYNPIPPIKPHPVAPNKPAWEQNKTYNPTLINDKYPFHGLVDPNPGRMYPNQGYYNPQQVSNYQVAHGGTNDWRSEVQILDQQIRPGNHGGGLAFNQDYNKYCRFGNMMGPIVTENGITINSIDFETHVKIKMDEQQRKEELMKSKLNLKEFLETWDEDEEASASNQNPTAPASGKITLRLIRNSNFRKLPLCAIRTLMVSQCTAMAASCLVKL